MKNQYNLKQYSPAHLQLLSIKELKKQEGFWNLAILGKNCIYCSRYCFSSIPASILMTSSSLMSSNSLLASPIQFAEILLREKLNCCLDKKFSLLSNNFMKEEPTLYSKLSCFSDEIIVYFDSTQFFAGIAVYKSSFKIFLALTGVSHFSTSSSSAILIFLLISQRRSSLFFWNNGWLKTLLECSFLDLWNPYMLSCRMNELILLCLKYLGSTTC